MDKNNNYNNNSNESKIRKKKVKIESESHILLAYPAPTTQRVAEPRAAGAAGGGGEGRRARRHKRRGGGGERPPVEGSLRARLPEEEPRQQGRRRRVSSKWVSLSCSPSSCVRGKRRDLRGISRALEGGRRQLKGRSLGLLGQVERRHRQRQRLLQRALHAGGVGRALLHRAVVVVLHGAQRDDRVQEVVLDAHVGEPLEEDLFTDEALLAVALEVRDLAVDLAVEQVLSHFRFVGHGGSGRRGGQRGHRGSFPAADRWDTWQAMFCSNLWLLETGTSQQEAGGSWAGAVGQRWIRSEMPSGEEKHV